MKDDKQASYVSQFEDVCPKGIMTTDCRLIFITLCLFFSPTRPPSQTLPWLKGQKVEHHQPSSYLQRACSSPSIFAMCQAPFTNPALVSESAAATAVADNNSPPLSDSKNEPAGLQELAGQITSYYKGQALFLCNICVVFRPVLPFGDLLFIHALTNATEHHKYSP